MIIEELMTTNLVNVAMDDSLAQVRELFQAHKFHHVLVVEDNRLVGVISDRDLLKALSHKLGTAAETTRDLATLNKRAHQVMHRQLVTLSPKDSLYQAIKTFNQHKVSCIPVVNEDNKPLGILGWRDVFIAIEQHQESKSPQH